uniref:Interleukin-3 receptor subunit alpha n=1 Tax=Panthera leo TaxID=9689 RepID=A0A8C8XNG7_PANLE
MQPETRRLTWDLSGNVSEIGCFINSRFITKATDKRYCEFRVLSSCQVTNFTVASTGDRPFSAGILYPRPEGHPEAAAQRLGCWVHDVDFLTCSWEAGRAAPGDVQYRLYWQDLKTYEEEECPRYAVDDRGTHIRCHFDDVSRLREHVQFLVKGTSKGARIPCSDLTVELARIERLSLPNITGMCNKSYSVMEWKMSSHFNHRFTYELEIQKGSDPAYTEKAPDSCFVLPNPGNYAVRLRAHARFRKTWSEWSAVRRFGEWGALSRLPGGRSTRGAPPRVTEAPTLAGGVRQQAPEEAAWEGGGWEEAEGGRTPTPSPGLVRAGRAGQGGSFPFIAHVRAGLRA